MSKGCRVNLEVATNTEPEKFFLRLAEESGKSIRNHFSWCYQGYGCKVIPDKDNAYKWTVEFDNYEWVPIEGETNA